MTGSVGSTAQRRRVRTNKYSPRLPRVGMATQGGHGLAQGQELEAACVFVLCLETAAVPPCRVLTGGLAHVPAGLVRPPGTRASKPSPCQAAKFWLIIAKLTA